MNIVICGGGIIGCATSYYLSKLDENVNITVVERNEIAGQASGKAGGFLALDWNQGPMGPIARKSYLLHSELRKEMENVDYRDLDTFSIESSSSLLKSEDRIASWVDGKVISGSRIGHKKTTSQVHPRKLTLALLQAAKAKGAKVLQGTVEGVEVDEKDKVKAVIVDGSLVPADIVLISMGPWSGMAEKFFPKCHVFPSFKNSGKVHSIVVEAHVSPEAVFLYHRDGSRVKDPEFYPRPDGTVYICGESKNDPLPDDPKDVVADAECCRKLKELVGEISQTLKDGKVVAEQACHLPWTTDGLPVLGPIPPYEEAFIASGHGCWGILNAPITGYCIACLMLDKKDQLDVDISALNLDRFKRSRQ